ncbi:hypothetical protein KKH38_02855 [Patescibacteria group bacterium]|nr:hypothetical protein [Patescibacteria group bacterium]MBU4601155.1 hypothetical protein [Patescibacteria group bacterium]MCG2697568.1 hypothetical protein [Candidatus Parcubacteria bacterium]
MKEKSTFNIKEVEVILGMKLNEIEKMGQDRFFAYFFERSQTIVLMPKGIFQKRIKKQITGCLEWLDEATCVEDAFSIFYKAMQTICNHLSWEERT